MGPGERVGDYEVVRMLGEGGMSWVYEVRGVAQQSNRTFRGRTFALKLMKPQVASADEFVDRFEREADLQVALDHPNFLTIFDYGLDPGSGLFFYTMNLVDGADLGDLVASHGPIDLSRIEPIFQPVLDALARLHEHRPPVVHRDVKPGNILLTASGHPYLGDLGIARVGDGAGHTRTSALLGTATFLSPEQARGRDVDARSDVFAVGLTLYHVLVGHSAYDDIEDVDARVDSDILGYLGHLERIGEEIAFEFPAWIPQPIQELIRRATRIRREDRPANAAELRAALAEALVAARQVEPARAHAGRGLRGRPRAVAAATIVLGAAALAAAFIVRFPLEDTPRARIEQLEALSGRVEVMLDRSSEGDARLAEDLMIGLRARHLLARDLLNVGRLDAEIGRPQDSADAIERAAGELRNLCRDMTAGGLVARADRRTLEFRQAMEELRAVDAPRYAPQHWLELGRVAGRLDATVAGPDACEQAQAALDRLAISAAATPLVDAVYDELRELQPEIARSARDGAARARTRASTGPVDARAYRSAFDEGDRSFRRGEALIGNDDRAAGAHFRAATAAYNEALEIAPTAGARGLARKRVGARAGEADSEALALYESGERLYGAGSWREARTQYERALTRQAGFDARDTRARAVEHGAQHLEENLLVRGDRQLASGRHASDGRRHREALDHLDRAHASYAEAERLARLGERRAWVASRVAEHTAGAWLEPGACDALAGATRESCRAGLERFAEGHEATKRRDSAEAIARFGEAEARFREIDERAGDVARDDPQPPVIVDQLPAADEVVARRGETIRLAVASYDADAMTPPADQGRPLRYVWRIGDGAPFEGEETLEVEFRQDVEVEVVVSDGDARTAPARTTWALKSSNHAPTLRVAPRSDGELRVTTGESLKFTATADDADGDAVQVSFLVDDEPVASGRRYTFARREPGRYDVRVVASDGTTQTVQTRRVEVQPEEEPGLWRRLFFLR